MTRRTSFKLALLSASALVLVSCGEAEEDALAYKSVDECINAGVHDAATCEAEYQKALDEHARAAPRYRDQRNCDADFGYNNCTRYQTSSGSFWLPFMVGYMMGPRIGGPVYTQPLYRPSSDPGNYYTAGNARVGRPGADGKVQVAQSQVKKPAARTRTVSRGGFGARAVSAGS